PPLPPVAPLFPYATLFRSRAYFAGREFAPDADGEIVVPYSTDPDARPIVLAAGRLATLATLRHRAENYDLHAAMHVEREALLARDRKSTRLNSSHVKISYA